MTVEDRLLHAVCSYIDAHNITCAEDVFQNDSANEACVNLTAKLVEIVLEDL